MNQLSIYFFFMIVCLHDFLLSNSLDYINLRDGIGLPHHLATNPSADLYGPTGLRTQWALWAHGTNQVQEVFCVVHAIGSREKTVLELCAGFWELDIPITRLFRAATVCRPFITA